jgi:class 3 adenylate cyclase
LLVCDIRGFSTMSEKTSSGQLAQVLGAWFRETGNLVAKTGGTVDKFIGDAILAYWGGDHAGNDCTAALDVGLRMLQLASERTWPNGDPFRIAVALHYGRVTCSNVGIAAERDATIIGDAVNTVFRLEAVAKELGQSLVLSGDCAEHLADREQFQDFGERRSKAKASSSGCTASAARTRPARARRPAGEQRRSGVASPGSALVPSAGAGVPPARTSSRRTRRERPSVKSPFPRDAETSTRDECAPQRRAPRKAR